MDPLFSERYCQRFNVPPAAFRDHLLRRTLHGPARCLLPVVRRLNPTHFDADLTYLDCVGRVRGWAQLRNESRDFNTQRENRRWLRRIGQLRVSVARVHDVALEVLGPPAGT